MSKDLEIEKMLAELNEKEEVEKIVVKKTTQQFAYRQLFNSEDIRNGIILSEILGPPKGKR